MFYLITVLAVKEYPTQLNDFRRILGDIYSMLVASCGNVDDHISVQLGNGDAIAGHVGEFDRGKKKATRRLLESCIDVSVSNMQRVLLRERGCGWMWRQTYFNASNHFSRPFSNE